MSKSAIAFVVLMLLAGVALYIFRSPTPTISRSTETPSREAKISELAFTDYNAKSIPLASFAGQPLVINSWASWCPYCKAELKDFANSQKEFAGRILVIAIDRGEPLTVAKKYTDELGVTNDLLFLLDPGDTFYKAIQAFAMPETIFVSREGFIVDRFRGQIPPDVLREKIQKLL